MILDGGQHVLHPKALGQLRNDDALVAIERLNQQVLAVGQVRDVDQFAAIHGQILVEQALGVFTLGLDAIIQMPMQRRLDVLHASLGFHQGKIPLHHEVLVMQRGGILADG